MALEEFEFDLKTHKRRIKVTKPHKSVSQAPELTEISQDPKILVLWCPHGQEQMAFTVLVRNI